ncbi:hypothetical protein AbraIFM66951_005278 [Aspergillus brasiliensis]|uniref:Uncharacterized protein n=1 Tax=Aspergillus brasiliensis TaxID=319629 RepID=A0A9W5Z3L5_9EURO|nr:hypothetical protein AbraCBS73388_004684 [Aspergillus brasiliensis]GKZ38356.1 hypothetical protein AbraIFM66950_010513 [Aspergillus brasiliensis]GKZ51231.1 hypothetical protein AbraIFM66951_005278 [Aspergillus brasiliensis]
MRTAPELHVANGSNLIATFHLAQKAPLILQRQSSSEETFAPSSPQGKDNHGVVEQLLFSCLQSGDDKSALLCTEQLAARFGVTDERIAGLTGMYEEAVAESQSGLEECLQRYDLALSENPVNLTRSQQMQKLGVNLQISTTLKE